MPALASIEPSEAESLLVRSRAGDSEAFCELCRFHENRLLRQAMTLCRNEALAEDLAQDTLMEAWKCLRRYNGKCQFFTWLCAILLNRYRNTVRQKRPTPFSFLGRDDQGNFQRNLERLTDGNSCPDQAAELREQAALVLGCIQTLPPKHQEVIYLRFYVDHSLEGIAAALDCSVGTVKSRLFRALDNLREMPALSGQPAHLESRIGNL